MARTNPVKHEASSLIAYHRPAPRPACIPFAPHDKFYYGQERPGTDWCITWCTPKEYGRWVQQGPRKRKWNVTTIRGKNLPPACKPGSKTQLSPPRRLTSPLPRHRHSTPPPPYVARGGNRLTFPWNGG
jgi:hypothetical protein